MSNIFDTALNRWRALTTSDLAGGGGGGSVTTIDREIVVTTYRVKTAFSGASVNDTVTCTQVLDVTAAVSTVATVWRNQTTTSDLGSVPSAANLELLGAQALTDTQLRAAAVAISAANLPLPTGAATAAKQDAALSATQAWMPQVATTVTLAVTTTSSAAQAVTAGESVRFSNAGTSPVAIMFGTSAVVATEATSLDIMPGSAETITIAAGVTHFAAIMQSGTGRLKFTRGAGA